MRQLDRSLLNTEVERLVCRLHDDFKEQYSMKTLYTAVGEHASEVGSFMDRVRSSLERGFDIPGDDLKNA